MMVVSVSLLTATTISSWKRQKLTKPSKYPFSSPQQLVLTLCLQQDHLIIVICDLLSKNWPFCMFLKFHFIISLLSTVTKEWTVQVSAFYDE